MNMNDMGNIHKEITIPNNIFLKGFPSSTTEDELEEKFCRFGTISKTKIIRDRHTDQSKCYGFITFDSQLVAENVLETYKSESLVIQGAEVTVASAKYLRRPPNRYFRYGGNPHANHQQPPPMEMVRWSDGLFTFHPTLVPISPIYLPVEQQRARSDGDPYNSPNSVNDSYAYSPNSNHGLVSKPGKMLPIIEETDSGYDTSESNSNVMSPVKTSSDYNRATTFSQVDVNRKNMSINAAYMGTNQLPVINHHSYVNANGQCGNPVDLKAGLTTTSIGIHLPDVNGYIPNGHHIPNGHFPAIPYDGSSLNPPLSMLNENMTNLMISNQNQCVPVFATILPPVEPSYVKPEPRKTHPPIPSSIANRNKRVSNSHHAAGVKMNGETGQLTGADLKGHEYVFVSTGPGKVNRMLTGPIFSRSQAVQ